MIVIERVARIHGILWQAHPLYIVYKIPEHDDYIIADTETDNTYYADGALTQSSFTHGGFMVGDKNYDFEHSVDSKGRHMLHLSKWGDSAWKQSAAVDITEYGIYSREILVFAMRCGNVVYLTIGAHMFKLTVDLFCFIINAN